MFLTKWVRLIFQFSYINPEREETCYSQSEVSLDYSVLEGGLGGLGSIVLEGVVENGHLVFLYLWFENYLIVLFYDWWSEVA